MREYKIVSDQLFADKVIDTSVMRLNAIVFTNRGTNPVTINGEVLNENESLSNYGLDGEIDRTKYVVSFNTAGAGTSACYVRMKLYK